MARLGTILLLVLSISGICAGKRCFFPNGQEAKDDYPCDADDHAKPFCCDRGVDRIDVFPSRPSVLAVWDTQSSQFTDVQQTRSSSSSTSEASTTLTNMNSESPSTNATYPTTASASRPRSPTPTTPTSDLSSTQESFQPEAAAHQPILSLAAQAGIGAGAGILAFALAAVAYLLVKLRKKRSQLAEMTSQQLQQQYNSGSSGFGFGPGWGLYDQLAAGRDKALPRSEMDAQAVRAELPSDNHGGR